MEAVLVIDLGTTGLRGAVIDAAGTIVAQRYAEALPSIPAPGLVEQDAVDLYEKAVAVAEAALDASGPAPGALGITVQRATTVVWDATTGLPVGPAIGWQDLRTLGDCLGLAAEGIRMAPNASGTKAAYLVKQAEQAGIARESLRFGTLDSWLAWKLTSGAVHVTDPTNAGLTGMVDEATALSWNMRIVERLGLPETSLPRIVPSSGVFGSARIGGRELMLTSLVGDQQASLIGQGGYASGVVKTTYGTACMTDVNVGAEPRPFAEFATYPVVVCQTARPARTFYGLEATVITGGAAIRGMVDLGIASSPQAVTALAASVPDSGGVRFVPALLGLGTPYWDYGARATLVGLTLGSGSAEIARAVLEGIAARVTECVRQLQRDSGITVKALRVDGGAAAADVICQVQADQLGVPVLRSAEAEATALGAGLLAGLATGLFGEDHLMALPRVDRTFEPEWDDARRAGHDAAWEQAIAAAQAWVPELSALKF